MKEGFKVKADIKAMLHMVITAGFSLRSFCPALEDIEAWKSCTKVALNLIVSQHSVASLKIMSLF